MVRRVGSRPRMSPQDKAHPLLKLPRRCRCNNGCKTHLSLHQLSSSNSHNEPIFLRVLFKLVHNFRECLLMVLVNNSSPHHTERKEYRQVYKFRLVSLNPRKLQLMRLLILSQDYKIWECQHPCQQLRCNKIIRNHHQYPALTI